MIKHCTCNLEEKKILEIKDLKNCILELVSDVLENSFEINEDVEEVHRV
jgi:hypothetical protein